jgi:hypothetical protein
MGKMMSAYRILVGKLEGKKPLRRPKRKWEDSIKMEFREWRVWIGFICLRKGTGAGLL